MRNFHFSGLFRFAIALTISACAPVIAHGPNVRAGFSGGVSGALGNGPTYENGDDPGPFYVGAATISAAYGLRPGSDSRPAFRFGLQAPTEGGVAVDLFAQSPRKWFAPMSAGAGILADVSVGRQMPYAQAGLQSEKGLGLNYAIGRYTYTDQRAGYTIKENANVNWLTFQLPSARWATIHLHAGYAFGHVEKTLDRQSVPYVDEDRWVKLGGITFEIHRR